MPCNTIQRSTVSLELRADNQEFLVNALKSLNYSVNVSNNVVRFSNYRTGVNGSFVDGKLRIDGETSVVERFDVNEVKRAYSRQVVEAAAKRFGWQANKKSETEYEVKRRR